MLQSKSSFFASCFGRVTGVRREQLRGQTIGNLLAQGALRLRGEVQLIGELLLPPRVRPCIHSGNPRHAERQLRGADPLHKGQGAARGVDGHLHNGQLRYAQPFAEGGEQAGQLGGEGRRLVVAVTVRLALVPQQSAQPGAPQACQRCTSPLDGVLEQLAPRRPLVHARVAHRARHQAYDGVIAPQRLKSPGERHPRPDAAGFAGVDAFVQRLGGWGPFRRSIKRQDLLGARSTSLRHNPVPSDARARLPCVAAHKCTPAAGHVALPRQ
mmetsp:Transcript_22201/g.55907  ORF Transcript_22201/g.55907 Transcript_22201/m.55907 type:complete len:269 (-) Transcript_22201:136-942(-)